GNLAAVLADDGVCRRQAEPAGALPGSEIGIEYPRQNIFGNAAAVVPNRDPDPGARSGTVLEKNVLCPNFDGSTFRHRLAGIEEDIVEHLPDLARIDLSESQVFGDMDRHA